MPPTLLLQTLRSVRRRAKLLGIVHGVGQVLAVTAGVILWTVLLDYLLNLHPIPRVMVVLTGLIVLMLAAASWVVRPILSRMTLTDVAGRLERVFPQFEDRLRSTVNFLTGDIPGSQTLKQRVIHQTTDLAARVDLHQAVVAKPALQMFGLGLLAVLCLLVLAGFAVSDQFRDTALARLLTPFSAPDWPRKQQIEMVDSIPDRIAVGQRLPVRMKLIRGDNPRLQAVVFYQYGDSAPQREVMQRDQDGTFSAMLDARIEPGREQGTMRVWIQAGDDRIEAPTLTVVPRLQIRSISAHITPPDYVNRPVAWEVNLQTVPAVAVEGSQLRLHIDFNKPLQHDSVEVALVDLRASPPWIDWRPEGETGIVGQWTAHDSLRFNVRAHDTDGFANTAVEEFQIIVRPDQQPAVQIENPRRSEERTADSTVPLVGLVEDDYGVESLLLVVQRVGSDQSWTVRLLQDSTPRPGVSWQVLETSGDRHRYRAQMSWRLADLPDQALKPGDVLEYHLLVQDNFNLNGRRHEPVASGRLRITIISQDELNARVIDELRQVRNQINELRNVQTRTQQETLALTDELGDASELDPTDRTALERLVNRQATAASRARQLSDRVDEIRNRLDENASPNQELRELSRDVAADLNRAAEQSMKEALRELGQIAQVPAEGQKRQQSMRRALDQQRQAADQLQQAMDRLSNIGTFQQTLDRVRDLLHRQQELTRQAAQTGREMVGKTPEQLSEEQRKRLEELADRQQRLADETNKTVQEMNRLAEQMTRSDPASAQAMQQAARTAQQQNVAQNQSRAANHQRQNQQSQARSAQRQAEIGLEMVLRDLREAERRRLRELSRQLAELQEQLDHLVRRQAGHNLDNLTLQGPQRLAAAGELVEELNTKAQRQARDHPEPELRQLSQSQEQTERNTRDLNRLVEALPDGAATAAHLMRAASRMERAIVELRQSRLPSAYDPLQVEALVALEQAAAMVRQQQQQVDDQIAQEVAQAIRAKFQSVRDDQEKINQETARIDATRDAQGRLTRAEGLAVARQATEQGRLVERVDEISQELIDLGSIVYVWANKDIAATMNQVRDDLNQARTDAGVQSEQQRILDQLDAMIRNLAIEPIDSRFATDAAGGGGAGGAGGAQPGLPSEAELRLLRELQQAVNDSTKRLHAEPVKHADRIVETGQRQGTLRELLDQMIQQASRGQRRLGPEPDNKDTLPEETTVEAIEADELLKELLHADADQDASERQVNLIGDRMARSRQRLALNRDPGKTTQLIQERILIDFDQLIEQARQQQAEARNAPRDQQNQQRRTPQQQQGQMAQNTGRNSSQQTVPDGAQQSETGPETTVNLDASRALEETAAEWGRISPRLRDAAVQGAAEEVIGEYRQLVEDYYRSVAHRATER